jgi:hypothetical protein
VATPGAIAAMEAAAVAPADLLRRHVSGDWGDVAAEDAAENELSVREGFRILSSYTLPGTDARIWLLPVTTTYSPAPQWQKPRVVTTESPRGRCAGQRIPPRIPQPRPSSVPRCSRASPVRRAGPVPAVAEQGP